MSSTASGASGDVTNCTQPSNISNSEGFVSADPLLLSDPAGTVHLFWAERLIGDADAVPNVPDSLMYAHQEALNPNEWSRPVDIAISPPQNYNKRISSIRGVIDDQGIIRLVWLGPDETFFYSFAHADEAGSARAWQTPLQIDNKQTGTQYSVDIAYTTPQTLHIVYGRSQSRVNRTLVYIRSVDGGLTWSDPVDIQTFLDFGRGASNIRLHVDTPNKLYVTWTEWDISGKGQAVYFARSLDNGLHWESPTQLAERVGDEYERDWTNLAILGENQLMAFWEGGFRAYPQAQYSYDGGVTWSEPIDTLFWLIADNGFAEFVRDSHDRLHLFIARRIREGFTEKCATFVGCSGEGNAIWHSVWESGVNWREPRPVDFTFGTVNFIAVTLSGGNQITLAWFSYDDLEVNVMNCQINDAPAVVLAVLPTVTPTAVQLPDATATVIATTAAPTEQSGIKHLSSRATPSTARGLLFSTLLPAGALLVLMITVIRRRYHL